jgi:hypothetical protein
LRLEEGMGVRALHISAKQWLQKWFGRRIEERLCVRANLETVDEEAFRFP